MVDSVCVFESAGANGVVEKLDCGLEVVEGLNLIWLWNGSKVVFEGGVGSGLIAETFVGILSDDWVEVITETILLAKEQAPIFEFGKGIYQLVFVLICREGFGGIVIDGASHCGETTEKVAAVFEQGVVRDLEDVVLTGNEVFGRMPVICGFDVVGFLGVSADSAGEEAKAEGEKVVRLAGVDYGGPRAVYTLPAHKIYCIVGFEAMEVFFSAAGKVVKLFRMEAGGYECSCFCAGGGEPLKELPCARVCAEEVFIACFGGEVVSFVWGVEGVVGAEEAFCAVEDKEEWAILQDTKEGLHTVVIGL